VDSFSNILSENPTYLIIAVVFSIVILFSLAKKLLKITLVALSVFILWTAYTVWTGQEISNDELKEKFLETGEKLKDSAIKKAQEKTKEELLKK
jgi:predicted tellurium resistance membrane protein TerC|tara:strand:- start:988 stop:1269 length:282 start_codon:yes stop_codon:yes gene_type:complete